MPARLLAWCVRPGVAWLLLTLALAIHVADEAIHDFLSTYNPIARSVRARVPFLPLPTFSFGVWLAGLIAGLIVMLAIAPFAFQRAAWLRPIALVIALFMVANAGLHLGGSLVVGTVIPGTYSAPLLLAAALCLLVSSIRRWTLPAASLGG